MSSLNSMLIKKSVLYNGEHYTCGKAGQSVAAILDLRGQSMVSKIAVDSLGDHLWRGINCSLTDSQSE